MKKLKVKALKVVSCESKQAKKLAKAVASIKKVKLIFDHPHFRASGEERWPGVGCREVDPELMKRIKNSLKRMKKEKKRKGIAGIVDARAGIKTRKWLPLPAPKQLKTVNCESKQDKKLAKVAASTKNVKPVFDHPYFKVREEERWLGVGCREVDPERMKRIKKSLKRMKKEKKRKGIAERVAAIASVGEAPKPIQRKKIKKRSCDNDFTESEVDVFLKKGGAYKKTRYFLEKIENSSGCPNFPTLSGRAAKRKKQRGVYEIFSRH